MVLIGTVTIFILSGSVGSAHEAALLSTGASGSYHVDGGARVQLAKLTLGAVGTGVGGGGTHGVGGIKSGGPV